MTLNCSYLFSSKHPRRNDNEQTVRNGILRLLQTYLKSALTDSTHDAVSRVTWSVYEIVLNCARATECRNAKS